MHAWKGHDSSSLLPPLLFQGSGAGAMDRDPNFVPSIPERYNKYVAPSNSSTVEPNAPTMDAFRDELVTALSLAWG
jgi:hypothetical protein